ncbi:MAG: alkaline phosphatase family protein [Terriglobales bacterium]
MRSTGRFAVLCGTCGLMVVVGILSGCGGVSGTSVTSSGPWSVALTQLGQFAPGGTGQYSITATNGSTGATSGTVTVSDSLPSVFTASSASGTGWNCNLGSTVTCNNQNALSPGASYPVITLTVHVATGASGTETDQVTVAGGGPSGGSGSIQTKIGSSNGGQIQHVVIIFQENRTPDNLFHDPVLMNRTPCPGACADIATSGKDSSGKTITLQPVSLATDYDMNHGHDAFTDECDWDGTECVMDGADEVVCAPAANCPANPQFAYIALTGTNPSYSIQPYFTMAETYSFGDRMFQTNEGPSMPAHQYILSGTSAVCVPGGNCFPGTTSTYYLAGNPSNDNRSDSSEGSGCLAPPSAQVNLIDTSQPFPNKNLIVLNGQECMDHPTLTDILDANGLSWKYYAAEDGYIWDAPDGIQHICEPAGPEDQLYCNGTEWNEHVVIEGTGAQVVTDIQNCQLPTVTWIIPDGAASDHAYDNDGTGPAWVTAIVNQIGTNAACPGTGEQYWDDTAIILTWDDWGGWYDHVPPPIRNSGPYQNSYEYGFRVPIVVISPYAKPAYVSHQYNDFGSILKFIEEMFSLPEINPAVGYADTYALGDLSDFFDFTQTPLTFTPIPAPEDEEYFINRKGKPRPPDND